MRAAVCTGALALPAIAWAQTSGSWVVDSDGSWSVGANWSSNPSFPASGGTATFGLLSNTTAGRTVFLNTNVSLNGLVFDTPFNFTVTNPTPGSNTLTLTGPGSISVLDSVPDSATLFSSGHRLDVPIAGSSGLNKSGPGSLFLTGTNAFTGGVTVSGGSLWVRDANDAALGSAANAVTLSNGAALTNTSASAIAFVSARNFVMGSGGGEVRN
ncbi:MAG: autotransporter-associated beta strand repeat-containing protein, partial [Tepidisphaeraceae bacterium]